MRFGTGSRDPLTPPFHWLRLDSLVRLFLPRYRAPELLLRSTNYNSPVDIFALGCIMAELYTFCPLFPGTNEVDQLNKIVKILGTPDKADWPEGYKLAQSRSTTRNNLDYYFSEEKGVSLGELIPDASMEAIDLIESMLQYSSRKRPTAAEYLPPHSGSSSTTSSKASTWSYLKAPTRT